MNKYFGKSLSNTLFILAPLVFTFAVALDIYVPTIPHLLHYFHTSSTVIQMRVSLFLLLTGLGQLVFGPWSDQVGRRKIILFSIVLFLIGSIICATAPVISILILGRAIEGAGACGMMVCAFAVVRDCFDGDKLTRMYSFLNSLITLSPLLAPILGGYLDIHFGWRYCFGFLVVMSLCILMVCTFLLPETLEKQKRVPFTGAVFQHYWDILKNKQFQTFAFAGAAGIASFLTYFSMSSYILITLLKVKEENFGYIFGVISIIFFFGSLLCGALATKFGTYRIVLIGTILMVISGVTMFIWYHIAGLTLLGFLLPMVFMEIGGAFVMGAGAGGAIEPFGEMAGTASAMFGAIEFVFGFIVSSVVMLEPIESTVPLAATMFILGAVAFLLCLVNKRAICAAMKR